MADELTGCLVYKRGEAPEKDTVLGEFWGWFVVVGFGVGLTIGSILLSRVELASSGRAMTSERFNTAGRSVGAGLSAAVIVSQWTWAATLLMSSNMGWRVGISGPFWYASGATIQILLFAILAVQVKTRVSHMHTFTEIVKARFGTTTHLIMICFALMANMIVTAMLLLGGSATIADLTGMPKIWAAFLIPLVSCWLYTMHGGLKASMFAAYLHTIVILLTLIIFTLAVYAGGGDSSELYGSPGNVYNGLAKASVHAYFDATTIESNMTNAAKFSAISSYIENDGTCYTRKDRAVTDKGCSFTKRDKDAFCCSEKVGRKLKKFPDSYCRTETGDCIDVSKEDHYESTGCDADEICVPSLATMGSPSGLLFGITNIVGNFGTVFVDQSYWQSAVAAKPRSAVLAFLIGGLVWFAVPFAMATTNGLAGRALTTHPDLGPLYITAGDSGAGLTPARVLSHILGSGGAFILLVQLFCAITSTGSAEIIAVASILTYDVYYEYVHPELKDRRLNLKRIFYDAARKHQKDGMITVRNMQALTNDLVLGRFFEQAGEYNQKELSELSAVLQQYVVDGQIATSDIYAAFNRVVNVNSLESTILLRVSKFFTGVFAIFMGFLAVFLEMLGFNLGWVYMSMGVLIGSAVGPAAMTICYERARGRWVGAGAVGGLVLGMLGWIIKAQVDSGEVTYETLGSDWPWVVGNLCAIFGGFIISGVGSLLNPDTEFRWEMLNDRIPLVDDVEPPRGKDEAPEMMTQWLYIAIAASGVLTFIMIVLWPLPMHAATGVFGSGGFTFWVVLEIFWVIVGGVVITITPLYETVMQLQEAAKERLERELAAAEAENDKDAAKKQAAGKVNITNMNMSPEALQAMLDNEKQHEGEQKGFGGLRKIGNSPAVPKAKAKAMV